MNKRISPGRMVPVFLTFLISFTSFGQFTGNTYVEATASKTAKFYYVHDGTPRFAAESNNQFSGIAVDIMTEFEKFLNQEKGIQVTREVVYKDSFEGFMNDIKSSNGGVFGLSNISITEERKQVYSFSPPYLYNVLVLLTNGKVKPLASMENISESFSGMTACTLPASSYKQRLEEIKKDYFPAMTITEYDSEAEIIDILSKDETAFAFLDITYYLEVLQRKLMLRRHSVGDEKNDQFGIIMPKSSDWAPVITEFFSTFIGSPAYSKMVSDNMGSSSLRLLEVKK